MPIAQTYTLNRWWKGGRVTGGNVTSDRATSDRAKLVWGGFFKARSWEEPAAYILAPFRVIKAAVAPLHRTKRNQSAVIDMATLRYRDICGVTNCHEFSPDGAG